MLWALRQNDPGRWLAPRQSALDEMLALIGECDGPFKYALDRYKYPQRYENICGTEYRDQAVAWLVSLNGRLASYAFLFGVRPALADRAIAPFVRHFAHKQPAWFQAPPKPEER